MSRQLYKFSQELQRVVPIAEALEVEASIHIIRDEMPPTRNPLNPREVFTSQRKLRDEYKRAGVVEIGDAYDNGYRPERIKEEKTESFKRNLREQIIRTVRGRE